MTGLDPERLPAVTLLREVEVAGVGIHTGAPARVRLLPAPPGTGILFRVATATGSEQDIPARAANVVDTSRCTVLGNPVTGTTISTVEHLLSALAGLGVADLVVEVTGPELPIGDGSALIWVKALEEAGLQGYPQTPAPCLTKRVQVTGKGGAFVAAYPSDCLRLTVAVSFPDHSLVGTQVARYEAGSGYEKEVAPARTFGFIEEVEALRRAGLALGGSLDNAVVVYPDRYSAPLRFEDELARHKLLDLLGDMMLCGARALPRMDIVAVRPSHRLNVTFAAALAEQIGARSPEFA